MNTENPRCAVSLLCETLEVSRSGHSQWAAGKAGAREKAGVLLRQKVKESFNASRQGHGCRRVRADLQAAGNRVTQRRVARLMRGQRLQGRRKHRHIPRTTQSDHDGPIAPNRLQHAAKPSRCDQVWRTDITYIPTAGGWLYLAVIIDAHSRRILGRAFSDSLETSLVIKALRMAIALRGRTVPAELILHSARGVQYASERFRAELAACNIRASMSRRANCYDNAQAESFFSTLKLELAYRTRFATADQARSACFEWIEALYNPRRRHSSIGYPSPVDFENHNN